MAVSILLGKFFAWKYANEFLGQIVCDCAVVHCKLVGVVEKAGFHFLEMLSGSKVVAGKDGVRFPKKSNLIPSFRVRNSLPKCLKGVFLVFGESYLRRGSVSFCSPGCRKGVRFVDVVDVRRAGSEN